MANTTGKKHGGRKKGTPNRLTRELRTILKDVFYPHSKHVIILRSLDLTPKRLLVLIFHMFSIR